MTLLSGCTRKRAKTNHRVRTASTRKSCGPVFQSKVCPHYVVLLGAICEFLAYKRLLNSLYLLYFCIWHFTCENFRMFSLKFWAVLVP